MLSTLVRRSGARSAARLAGGEERVTPTVATSGAVIATDSDA